MVGLIFSHDAQHPLLAKLEAGLKIGLSHMLVPLVDSGSLENLFLK